MSKYGAIRTEVDGLKFASKAEAERYGQLKLLVTAGEIVGLKCHPRWKLEVNGDKIAIYEADFSYTDAYSGQLIVEDVKGVLTPVYKLKKKLMRAIHGIEVVEVQT